MRAQICSNDCTEGCAEIRARTREVSRRRYERRRGGEPTTPRPHRRVSADEVAQARRPGREYEGREAYLARLNDLFK